MAAGASKLFIGAEALAQARKDAERAYPDECCGIFYGKIYEGCNKEVMRAESIRNAFDETERFHRFRIPAEQMLAAELKARREELDIVGFYHSHPDHDPVPSEYDRSHALPVYSYLIIACREGRAAETENWVLDADTQSFISEEMKEI
ncbi:MAG: M67 family metallopeptidase [Lachnospiraceae bacterium]|nr:M67 family metallopeptidase [Lachnospiraceae bacterium]